MKVLYIQGGSKYYQDSNNNYYSDRNMNEKIWNRYLKYSNELTVIGRVGKHKSDDIIKQTTNEIPKKIKMIMVDDIYVSFKSFFNPILRKKIKQIIRDEIIASDRIVIRSLTNFYTLYAAKICRKLNKKYLVEVTGFAFESLWYHNFLGKILAIPTEILMKLSIKKSPNVLYVSKQALQKRYPNKYNNIGCSDVEITNMTDDELRRVIKNIKTNHNHVMVLGTIGNVDNELKGQKTVIRALSCLPKGEFIYEMVGGGSKDQLKDYAQKKGVLQYCKFVGEIPHSKVDSWLNELHIYIQPSYTEGLCRSIIEAMNRGKTIIATSVGGNTELCKKEYLFKKRNFRQLKKILERLNNDILIENANYNYKKSKEFNYEKLNKEREDFYHNFFSGD